MIRVAFYKGKRSGWRGFWDRVIRTVSAGPYSHCELVFGPDPLLWASSIAAIGVHCDHNGEPDPAEWDVIYIDCEPDAVIDFLCQEVCSPYDWFGVIRFALPGFKESPKKWFCSEICAAALQVAGILPQNIKPHTLSPTGLYYALNPQLNKDKGGL
ncbi:hypothetical protein KI809_18735 [Geobacter pelophilus]|uniref:Permuted papain-like amidase enzyme, YaeF/YiiX, C92 family n=1 Tax=Geoanaerobacter pelophilus TaxID=60036 RepID=A0AAW4L549_9BACT|nr:hypothetical protein [Geoanaerobacter pelophilus]MBT0666349.1 hypothetical protein [Geoanaerobacter pelophilus]